jgi:hypothetical protein
MQTVEKLFVAAFAIIALYLLFNSQEAGNVISSIGSNAGGIFGTLQGRTVNFGTGVSVSGGPLG